MSFKTILVLCAQALLFQSISAQCNYAQWPATPSVPAPCGGCVPVPCVPAQWNPLLVSSLSASNGPGFAVATASPVSPSEVYVVSENTYEGSLTAAGALPFLGTVALEGTMPSAGAGAVAYNCGSGVIGITAEDIGATGFSGIANPLSNGAGLAGLLTIGGPGCGCGCGKY